ncbi:MAG: hypothetical protein K2H82_04905 [Oscillospiraceae bacterium]|nr:hypothetical protein [Oscillospiraceae bacterium]
MLDGFEDVFMEAQADVVSFALELLENAEILADKIYLYLFQNEVQYFFNAFLEINHQVYSLNALFSDPEIDAFLDAGIEAIEHIIQVCDTYQAKCPNELKLTYQIQTKAFDAKYGYEDFVTEQGESLVDRFKNWKNEIRAL